jgi:Xaa-Pro dipeptidase
MDAELERLGALRSSADALPDGEYEARLERAASLMQEHGLDAVYLGASSSLRYFTGVKWSATERLVGAVLTPDGAVRFVLPSFEEGTFRANMRGDGELHLWREHESPFELVIKVLAGAGVTSGTIGIDEATPFHHFGELRNAGKSYEFVDARPVTAGCRTRKSDREIELIQVAMNKTLEVHKSAAAVLAPGVTSAAMIDFIDSAHKTIGCDRGSTFCAVQFGEATAYPHGVPGVQSLEENDIVLIDTGCQVNGYHSDITRTYVFGEPTDKQREVWAAEKAAQAKAFETAKPGVRCGDVDIAARDYLVSLGYGPEYDVPGLPHRTGHGIGLDIHEWPYLVRSDDTPLAKGMCFSNEPMLCLYGEFGVRLEDHFYMDDDGARWFTEPSPSIDDPFGLNA